MHTHVLPPRFTFQSFFLQSYCKLFPIRPARSQGQHRLFLESIIGVSLSYLSKGTNFNIHKRTTLMYSLPPYSAAIFFLLAMWAGDLGVRPGCNSGSDSPRQTWEGHSHPSFQREDSSHSRYLSLASSTQKLPRTPNLSHTCLPTEHPKSTCML